MNGKSRPHQARPITGTQISCCLRKNFRKGARRLNTRCMAKISTQLWWLLSTRYQLSRLRLSAPVTCQRVPWVSFIQPVLQATQDSEIQMIALVHNTRNPLCGMISFSTAGMYSSRHQNRVFRPSKMELSIPTTGAGKKLSMRNLFSLFEQRADIIAMRYRIGQWPEVTIMPARCDGFAMVPEQPPAYPVGNSD